MVDQCFRGDRREDSQLEKRNFEKLKSSSINNNYLDIQSNTQMEVVMPFLEFKFRFNFLEPLKASIARKIMGATIFEYKQTIKLKIFCWLILVYMNFSQLQNTYVQYFRPMSYTKMVEKERVRGLRY